MAFRNYILLFALVAGTIAGPINVLDGDMKCAKTCTESLSDGSKFQYTPGNTYTYTYEGTTETKLQGSSTQSTSLRIQATADIEVLSKCEYVLKLRGVTLSENGAQSSESDLFRGKLEANPLRFAFQDGKIEDVCSQLDDDERVLNIKRGILSTFQNSMSQLDKEGTFTETDISGTCPTTYTSKSGVFGGYTITKTKDILACTDRNGNISSIHSKRYMVPSKIQNVPLLKTAYSCEQDVKSGMVEKTSCREVHMFRPFSKEESGAVTTATQTLTYSTYKKSVSTTASPVQKRSSMLFHHLYDESIDSDAKSQVIATLQTICSEVNMEITKDTPILFGTLVSHMKKLSTDKMLQVYTSVNGGRVCPSTRGKQFFFDAIPMVATEASLALTRKLISEKVVQGAEAEMWLAGLAFIPRPTYSMLTMIKPLLSDESVQTRALLGVSAMVHKLCDNHADCARHPEVADFINTLTSNIGSDCSSSTSEQRNKLLVTLKAFGNAGDAVTSSSVIGRCITNRDVDAEVRVAALDAARRMPCSVSREDAMRLFQNAENDAELRIHAFKAVMVCPTTDVLTKVRMMLSGETVNQVGSYVWTFLENLKETSSPLRRELASILEDAKLREDFNLDVRKFSRNVEKSLFSEYLNAGAQVESDLIWSQKSYIPRSAMVNVTVDMFGNSINLLEIGGRVQGLEKIVEKFFGPNGYFTKKDKELMDNKRQTANYISPFDRAFKTPDDKIRTSMYLKMFGNEMAFNELDSDDWSKLQDFNLLDFLIKLAEPKKVDITKNYQFMDSSLIVPTCVGLPMNLTVNGTASVSLDIDGNVDLRNFAASPRSLDIKGHIKPSAAVVVSGLMGVDGLVTKSSMKMVASMHTSTMLDGKIQLQNGQVFNVELNTPQEKMEIFHIQTEFFMNGNEMAMPEPAKTFKKCSSPQVTKVIGMEMCVDVTLPEFSKTGLPSAPFTGPMNAQLFIEKKDTHTGYTFTAKMENERQQVSGSTYNRRLVHLSLDTPGSQVNRKLLAEAAFNPAEMKASAELYSPWKKFSWTGSLENTVNKKSAVTVMKIDENDEYSITADLSKLEKKVKTVWTPSLTIVMPNKPRMTVDGTFEMGSGKTLMAMDLSMKKFTRKEITVNTALTQKKGGESYQFTLKTDSDLLFTDVSSTVTMAPGNYNSQVTVRYRYGERPEHRFSTFGKFVDKSQGVMKSYSVQAGFVPTEYPQYSFSVDCDFAKSADHIDTKVVIEQNKEKMTLAHKTTKQGDLRALTLESETTFEYPRKSIDVAAVLKHKHNSNELSTSGSIKYAPGKTISSSVELDRKIAGSYNGEVTLSYPGRDMSLKTEVSKLSDNERKMTINAKWNDDADSQMTVTSSWKAGETHEITGDFKIPGYPVVISASVKPNLKDFMSSAEVTFKRQKWSLSSQYKLDDSSISSSVTYVCPQRTVTYEMSAASGQKLTADFDLKWDASRDASKRVALAAVYNMWQQSPLKHDGSVTFTSPLGVYTVKSDVEMIAANDVSFNLEYDHNGERCVLRTKASPVRGEFSLETPYIQYGPVTAVSAKYNVYRTSAEAEFSWNPKSKVSGTVRMSDDEYKVEMTTPFEMAKTMEITVTKPTETRRFSVSGKMNSNTASMAVSYPDFRSGELSAKYGDHTVSGSFTQNGDIADLNAEGTMTWNTKRVWAKLGLKTERSIALTLDMTTPFEEYKKMSVAIDHAGELTNFKTGAAFTMNNKQVRGTLSFSGKKAELTVKTPWRDMTAEYTINGDLESFNANSLVRWAADKEISGEMTFDMNRKRMTFSLASPFYSTVSGEFEHSGSWMNFNNKASLTYAPQKTVELSGSLSTKPRVDFTADLKLPSWSGKAVVSHTGSLKSWTNSAVLTIGDYKPVSFSSEFDTVNSYRAKVGYTNLPIEGFNNAEMCYEIKTAKPEMSAIARVTVNEHSIIANAAYNSATPYRLTASLESPWMETVSFSAVHDGSLKNFENTITAEWSSDKKATLTTTLSTRSGCDAKIRLDSPWRKMSFSVNQQGNANEFSASTTASWVEGQRITSSLEFSNVNEIKATWSLKTPFEIAQDITATMTHRGSDYKKFYNQLEGKYNGQQLQLGTDWDMRSGAQLEVVCVNPWKNFNTNVKYTGEPKDFTASADFTMDSKTYSTSLRSELTSDSMQMTFNLKPVVIKPISATMTLNMANSRATLTWGDSKTISVEATSSLFDSGNLSGSGSFSTPFEGFESGEMKFSHTGGWESFRDSMEMSFNKRKATIEYGFTSFGEMKGVFALSSPWYNANGEFRHAGDWKKFTNSAEFTYAQGKTVKGETEWEMNDSGVSAKWSLNTPVKSFEGLYRHEQTRARGLTARLEAGWDSGKQISSDLKYQNAANTVVAEFSATTPWKSVSSKYNHQGTMKTRCNADFELGWDGEKQLSADWSISQLRGFSTVVNVKTPWRNVSAEVTHEGSMTNFENKLSVTYETGKTVELRTEYKMSPEFYIKTALTSPFKNAEVSARQSGNLENFTCHAEAKYGDLPLSGDLEWNMRNGLTTKMSANTPWKNVKAEFSTNKDLKNLSSSASFEWGTQVFDAALLFNVKSGSITLKAPWRTITSKYESTGSMDNFSANASASWESGKEISMEASYSKMSGTGMAKLSTPWRTLSATGKVTGKLYNFDSEMSLSWETGKSITMESKMNMLSGMDMESKLITPWRTVSAELQYGGEYDNFSGKSIVSWETGKSITAELKNTMSVGYMNSEVTLKTPWRDMSAKYTRDGEYKKFDSTMELSWETDKKVSTTVSVNTENGYEGKITVNSPWRDLETSAKFSGDIKKFDSSFSLKWDVDQSLSSSLSFSMLPMSATWTYKCLDKDIRATFTHTGDLENMASEASLTYNNVPFTFSSTFDQRSGYKGSLRMTYPARTISASFDHRGDFSDFSNSAELSWESDKKIKVASSFKRSPILSGTVSLKTPFYDDISASFKHVGEMTNFENKATVSWAPTKSIEVSANFKKSPTMSGSASLKTPFYDDISASFEHSGDLSEFSNAAELSWASDKKIEVSCNFKKSPVMSGSASLKTPFYNDISASFEHNGEMTNFNNKATLSWASDKKIEVSSSFKKSPSLSGSASLKTPFYNDISASFEHNGEMTNFNNKATLSWASDKKIEVLSSFKKSPSLSGSASLKTPFYEDISASFEHNGEMTNFNNRATLSWASDKKIEASANFKKSPVMSGSTSLKTPFYDDISASFEHSGDLSEFSSSAELSWASDKKIEASANFKKSDAITGGALLKTPFSENLEASFEHTGDMTDFNNKASFSWAISKKVEASLKYRLNENSDSEKWNGEMSLKTPFFDEVSAEFKMGNRAGEMSATIPALQKMEAEYTFTDMLNWLVEAKYGEMTVKATNTGSLENGLRSETELATPLGNMELKFDHQGDYSTFTNTMEASWKDMDFKLVSSVDLANGKLSQSLEVPKYEKMGWSTEYKLSESSVDTDTMLTYGDAKIELQMNGNVEWKKYTSKWVSSVSLKTPFTGYEDNKLTGTMEYSGRLFKLDFEGFKGTSADNKKLELYLKNTSTATRNSANSYMKTTLFSDSESETSFTFSEENGVVSATASNDLKFFEASKFNAKLNVNHNRTPSTLNHSGSFEFDFGGSNMKLTWNAGSSSQMCETGFTATMDGEQMASYEHKTTWASEYKRLTHEMTLKSVWETAKDCEFKVNYDFTQAKKSVEVTIFNDPKNPFDFKLETDCESSVSAIVSTPFESYKTANVELTMHKQPYSVKMEGSLNGQSATAEGSLKNSGNGVFDVSVSFKSQIPQYEDMMMSVSNAAFDGQVKPHFVMQWASDKKIELSATISWANSYRAIIDLSTPFNRLRSLATDITVSTELLKKFDIVFTFKTNQMTKNLSGTASLDLNSPSLSISAESPFELFNSFELTAALKPRVTFVVKLDGKTLISINGNGQFESWRKHDIELTATYPFWNKYMHLKVNNDLSLSGDNSVSMDVELEYMRGKEMSLKYSLTKTSSTAIALAVTTPFEKFERMKYSVIYSGTPSNWNESTETEFYYGKVKTVSSFSMESGIAFHHTVTGDMKNGVDSFNHKVDLVFSGDSKKFDLQSSLTSSALRPMSFESSWDSSRSGVTVKGQYGEYRAEYTHQGMWNDFSCNYKVTCPQNTYNGNWSFKLADRMTVTARVGDMSLNLNGDLYSGRVDATWAHADGDFKYSANYLREASPFKYEGSSTYEMPDLKVETSFLLTKDQLRWSLKNGGEELMGLRAENSMNADDEYEPKIEFVYKDLKYDFDGLFKNEGEGLVRDFKLHLNGPRGAEQGVKLMFDFKTLSEQLVPGAAKIYLSGMNKGEEIKVMDMDAEWGNDRASVTFREPQPMLYTLDFSVDTTGQTVKLLANWDTTASDRNIKVDIDNKFVSYSKRLRSMLDIDVVYTGVSRGFSSELDWKTDSIAHKLAFDYNGKTIGYDFYHSDKSGCNGHLELISEWRSVKGTWTNSSVSGNRLMGFEFFWDSVRDMSKKLSGTSSWQKTATNTYKWISTFSHPALSKDIVFTDTIAYDTDTYVFSFGKIWSFSNDQSKDVKFNIAFEKNGKWGVELKQDFNNVDMKVGSEFSAAGNSNNYMTYKGTDGRVRNFNVKTTYNPSTKASSVEFVTPIKTMKFEMDSTRSSYNFGFSVDGKKYEATFTYRPEDAYLLVKLSDPSSKAIQFESMSITNGYQMQVVKTNGQSSVTEGLVAMSMNENKTINGKLYWNPALYSEVKAKLASVRVEMNDVVKRMSASSTREASKKMASLRLGSDFERIMPHYQTEAELLEQDLNIAKQSLTQAYSTDVFFMKSIDEMTGAYVTRIAEVFATVSDSMTRYYTDVIAPRLTTMGENTKVIRAQLMTRIAKIEESIASLKTTTAAQWIEKSEQIAVQVEALVQWLQTYADRAAEYVAAHPAMDTIKQLRASAMDKVNAVSDAAYNKVSAVADPQMFSGAIYSAHSYVSDSLVNSRLSTIVSSDMLQGLIDSLTYKLKFYYNYYDVSDNVRIFADHVKSVALEYVNDYLQHYVDEAVNNFQWKQYDLENGRVEFEFNIPTNMETVDFARVKANLMSRLDAVVKHMAKYHFNLKEMFYMYKPQAFNQILPPYNAQAIISGQQIRTFDRRHYDFSSGKCSYLLARDFQDGNFTVFVNYNGQEQSLTVHSNGLTFDIMQDNTVKMDGSKVELPIQAFNTTITHLGHSVKVSSSLGVEVVCNNGHGLCTVEMSGFYFAKTGGLFGTYNNEPSDDFTTSTNKNTTNVLEFANSWAASCTGTNKAVSFTAQKGTKEYEACAAIFVDSASPMSSCFGVVDPQPAFQKCVNEMSRDVTLTKKNGPCKAAKFYQAECGFAGLTISEPSHCVTCQMDDVTIEQGDSRQLSQVTRADVVFVVEEKMCNYNTDSKLPQLSKHIQSALSAHSFSDIRYGLVGFGGQGVHDPNHIHTMASKMFGSQNEFKLGTDALRFGEGENNDVLSAIDFAAQYPFRAGATKMVVVIPCSDCGSNLLSYRSLAARLISEGITLHVLNDFSYDVTVEGKNPETNYLFGIDNNAVYSMKDTRRTRGRTDLYSITNKPSDYCSSLALQTGGTIFDLNMMTKMQSPVIKNFQTVFANRLALFTYPSQCTVCSCEYNDIFQMARSVCKKC